MNISSITRSLNQSSLDQVFADLSPDQTKVFGVRWQKNQHLLANDPLQAGIDFHSTLPLLWDFAANPTPTQRAYLGWLSALRRAIGSLDADGADAEVRMPAFSITPTGTCDLLIYKTNRIVGVVETKVIVHGCRFTPRARDLFQLASYAHLQSASIPPARLWVALAYIELETKAVRFMVFKNSNTLVTRALEMRAAA